MAGQIELTIISTGLEGEPIPSTIVIEESNSRPFIPRQGFEGSGLNLSVQPESPEDLRNDVQRCEIEPREMENPMMNFYKLSARRNRSAYGLYGQLALIGAGSNLPPYDSDIGKKRSLDSLDSSLIKRMSDIDGLLAEPCSIVTGSTDNLLVSLSPFIQEKLEGDKVMLVNDKGYPVPIWLRDGELDEMERDWMKIYEYDIRKLISTNTKLPAEQIGVIYIEYPGTFTGYDIRPSNIAKFIETNPDITMIIDTAGAHFVSPQDLIPDFDLSLLPNLYQNVVVSGTTSKQFGESCIAFASFHNSMLMGGWLEQFDHRIVGRSLVDNQVDDSRLKYFNQMCKSDDLYETRYRLPIAKKRRQIEEMLREKVGLVQYPQGISGSYLILHSRILVHPEGSEQELFPIYDRQGRLTVSGNSLRSMFSDHRVISKLTNFYTNEGYAGDLVYLAIPFDENNLIQLIRALINCLGPLGTSSF